MSKEKFFTKTVFICDLSYYIKESGGYYEYKGIIRDFA